MNNSSLFLLLLLGCCLVAGKGRTEEDVDECTAAGYKCSKDCLKVIFCIANRSPARGFNKVIIAECKEDSGTFCDLNVNECTADSTCPPREFDCGNTGSYPDPIKCNEHHTCIVKGDDISISSQKCEKEYAYDPLSGSCLFDLNHDVCTNGPVPKCQPNSIGFVKLNPSIWYLCVKGETSKYHHKFFRCAHGKFDVPSLTCEDVTKDDGHEENTTIATSHTTLQVPFVCPRPGYFAFPGDCQAYYYCNSKLEPTKGYCDRLYFKESLQSCVRGECPK